MQQCAANSDEKEICRGKQGSCGGNEVKLAVKWTLICLHSRGSLKLRQKWRLCVFLQWKSKRNQVAEGIGKYLVAPRGEISVQKSGQQRLKDQFLKVGGENVVNYMQTTLCSILQITQKTRFLGKIWKIWLFGAFCRMTSA